MKNSYYIVKKEVKNYLLFFKIGLKHVVYYKTSMIIDLFFWIFTILFLFIFWTSLKNLGTDFVDDRFILFIVFGFTIGNTLHLNWSFTELIKSKSSTYVKDITYLITRRISPLSYDSKERAWSLVTFIICFSIILIFTKVNGLIDINQLTILKLIPFLIISHFLVSQFSLIISYFAFWFDDAWGFGYTFFMIIGFSSGALLPIYIMPEYLQIFFSFLPFQYLAYIPAQILIDNVSLNFYFTQLIIGIGWLIAVSIFSKWFYNKGLKKFESQGG